MLLLPALRYGARLIGDVGGVRVRVSDPASRGVPDKVGNSSVGARLVGNHRDRRGGVLFGEFKGGRFVVVGVWFRLG